MHRWPTRIFTGFVNFGPALSFDASNEELATEALVFMAVGITGHWKRVIGYFLIHGISSEVLKELVLHAISSLQDIGIQPKALTLDGLSTNMSMLRKLGCCMDPDNIVSHFETPSGRNIHVFIDACHSLKLIRNIFARNGVIEIAPDEVARWSNIVALNDLQKTEGLCAANKLTDRHIHYSQQIMKVSFISILTPFKDVMNCELFRLLILNAAFINYFLFVSFCK